MDQVLLRTMVLTTLFLALASTDIRLSKKPLWRLMAMRKTTSTPPPPQLNLGKSLENLHPQKSKGFVPACTARFSLDVLPGSPRHRGAAPLAPPFADSWIFHGSTRFSERLIYVVVKRVRLGSYSILRTELQLLQRSRHAIGTICTSSVFHIKFLNRDPVFSTTLPSFRPGLSRCRISTSRNCADSSNSGFWGPFY